MMRNLNYLIAFLVGQSIMILEITGAKLIAPVLGSSHLIWVVQITMTLAALAFGSFLYTKIKNDKVILNLLWISAFYSLIVTIGFQSITYLLLELSLELSITLTSFILYLFPLIILGAIFPLLAEKIKSESFVIGKLSAFSTLGSVLGSLLSGFVLIYIFTNRQILLVNVLVVLFVYILFEKNLRSLIYFCLAFVLVSFVFLEKGNKINSPYGEISVFEINNVEYILNDGLIQNTYDKTTKNSNSLFTYALEYFTLKYTPNLQKTYHIGLGIGVVPYNFEKRNIENKIVEINPEMIKLSKRYYDIENIFLGDGRYFVKKEKDKYDAVILDAFLVDSVPINLLTLESFLEMKNILKDEGVLVINSFGTISPQTVLVQSINKTLSKVFKEVKVFSIDEYNVFFVAGDSLGQNNVSMTIPLDLKDKFNALINSNILLSDEKSLLLEDNNSLIEVLDDSPRSLYRKKHIFN